MRRPLLVPQRSATSPPHADAIPWPGPSVGSITEPIELGPFEAELAEQAPDAMDYTDSIARLGRALAVNLVAATQRPTQKAMGQGAVRSQMDMRICFRVRESRDVDLVLGQGMLNAGWNAHRLNAPGKFLVSAPEHEILRRARAYLITDEGVAYVAARHAQIPRQLDYISRSATEQPPADDPYVSPAVIVDAPEEQEDAFSKLWAALSGAPQEGIPVSNLITITGMSRRWVFWRLKQLAERGEAFETSGKTGDCPPTESGSTCVGKSATCTRGSNLNLHDLD
jgi:hypothetical protein